MIIQNPLPQKNKNKYSIQNYKNKYAKFLIDNYFGLPPKTLVSKFVFL